MPEPEGSTHVTLIAEKMGTKKANSTKATTLVAKFTFVL
jgi:hypothetical protein